MNDKTPIVDVQDAFGFGLFNLLPPALRATIRRVESIVDGKDEEGTNDVPVEPADAEKSFEERNHPDIAEGLD